MSVILVKMTAQNMLHVLILWGHREVSSVFVMLGTLELALLALVSLVTVYSRNKPTDIFLRQIFQMHTFTCHSISRESRSAGASVATISVSVVCILIT